MQVINKRYEPCVPLDQIRPHPRNANQGDIGAIHQSIEANGFYGACIVQESTGYILAGNYRYETAGQQGAEGVPVIYVDCDDTVALRILLADNRVAALADTDPLKLSELLESIRSEFGTFDGTGYDEDTYENLLKDLADNTLKLDGSGVSDQEHARQQKEKRESKQTADSGDEKREGKPHRCPACQHEWEGRCR